MAVDLLNFGAFIAFIGVNASALVHGWKTRGWTWSNGLPSILGFLICFYIWLNLSPMAKLVGGLWLLTGMGYGALSGSLMRRPARPAD